MALHTSSSSHCSNVGLPKRPLNPLSPSILLVDDHHFVRIGTMAAISAYAEKQALSVSVLQALTLAEALAAFAQTPASLVMLDLHLPDSHGLSGLSAFLRAYPTARIVVMTADSTPALQAQANAMGAVGFVRKNGDVQNILEMLFSLLDPRTACSPQPQDSRSGRYHNPKGHAARTLRTASGASHTLTARQAQLVDWVLSGKNNKEIADLVHLSEGTVKNHVSNLFAIVGVRSRAQFISYLR